MISKVELENYHEFGDGGIILIKIKDNISNLICDIIGLEFNIIGFYYRYNNDYELILLNIIPNSDKIINFIKFSDFIKRKDIETLIYKKIVKSNSLILEYIKKYNWYCWLDKKDIFIKLFYNEIFIFTIFNNFMLSLDNTLIIDKNICNSLYDSYLFSESIKFDLSNNQYLNNINYKYLSEVVDINIGLGDKKLLEDYLNISKELYNVLIDKFNNNKLQIEEHIDIIKIMELMKKNHDNILLDLKEDKRKVNIDKNYQYIKNLLTDIYNNVKLNRIAYIKYNEIVNNFNIICKNIHSNYKDLKMLDDNTSYNSILISNDMNIKDIPALLKTGKKIYIPMNDHNYSRYTFDELEEMLTILDVYSSGNNKFDEVRSLITKCLANKI